MVKGIKITVALTPAEKKISCSFFDIVGSICGVEECARYLSTQTVSLSLCRKDIRSHKHFLQFSVVETELTLARSGIFIKPVNFFGNDCLPVASIKPWDWMEKSW